MTDVLELKQLSKKEKEALKELVSTLVERYFKKIRLLELFGSKARGDSQRYSDIDMLIVTEQKDNTLWDSILDFIIDLDLKYEIDISPRFLEQREFNRLWKMKTPFMNSLKNEGIEIWRR